MKNRTHNQPQQEEMRKELRTHGTSAEASMWLLLKARQMDGVKFRRQFSVGPYILDFYAPELKLGIELDGAHHYSYCGTKSDNLRSEYLKQNHGIYLLRFENIVIFIHFSLIFYYFFCIRISFIHKIIYICGFFIFISISR